MKSRAVTLVIDDANWRKKRGLAGLLRRAADAALVAAGRPGSLTLLLSGDARLRSLNRKFRGKDKPTNVLSFPAAANTQGYCGDVAIAYGTAHREAEAAAKNFSDHAAHLVVHGVLHLAGYDHHTARQANAMEPLETRVLARLGIGDPYAGAR